MYSLIRFDSGYDYDKDWIVIDVIKTQMQDLDSSRMTVFNLSELVQRKCPAHFINDHGSVGDRDESLTSNKD